MLDANEDGSPKDYPRGYEVFASDDPNDFGRPIASGTGDVITTINFDEVTARYVRIEQTGNDDRYWWSIHELDIN